MPHASAADRFEAKVERIPEAGCWIWIGATARGYGRISIDGKHKYAHRFSWEKSKGEIPVGLDVLHRCDLPSCVNPEHLFIGTHQENMADMARKGRAGGVRGKAHGNSKLTETDVLSIRASGETQRDLALKHGVTQTAISAVVTRKLWQHV